MAADPKSADGKSETTRTPHRPVAPAAPSQSPSRDVPVANWTSRETGKHLHIDAGTAQPSAPRVTIGMRTGVASPADLELLPSFVYEHGDAYDSYLATEPGRNYFWSANRMGVVSYVQRGLNVLAGGGLIAAPENKERLLQEFIDFNQRHGHKFGFLNICEDELPLFRKYGFQVTKWGEEGIIDLGNCTWGGKAFEWVRRQTNFCLRHGLVAFEVKPDELEPEQWARTIAEVREVATESLSKKPQSGGMRFFEGRIDDHELGLRRLFIARSDGGLGRIEGFVICNPMKSGALWSTELYRHRTDSVRGTVAFLFHHLLQQLQAEGVKQVNLCLDPGRNCSIPIPGDSWLIRYGWPFGEKYASVLFDFAGLRHFKSRFRPRFESRYVVALPHVTFGLFWSFLMVLGGFRINIASLVRVCLDRIRKWNVRKTMVGDDGE